MRIGRRTSSLGAALLAGVLVLAACGGDDAGSSADTTAAAAAATTAAGSGSAGTTAADGSSETTVDTNFSGDDSEAFCSKLQEFEDSPVLNGEPSFDNPDELRTQYEAIQDAIGQLADVAPGEIEDDVATMQSGLKDLIALFEEYDYDFAKITADAQADPALADRLDSIGSGDMDAASQRLSAYGEQVCGITDTTAG